MNWNSFISGTFKAKYRGIYQFSVAVQFCGTGTYEFELVRGNRSGGNQVLALGKSKNREVDIYSIREVFFAGNRFQSKFRYITDIKYQWLLWSNVGQMIQLTVEKAVIYFDNSHLYRSLTGNSLREALLWRYYMWNKGWKWFHSFFGNLDSQNRILNEVIILQRLTAYDILHVKCFIIWSLSRFYFFL